jgi:GNAT superfamily N-acetyltransferase
VEPTLSELAEHTEVHLLPRARFETVQGDGYVFVAGLRDANLYPDDVADVERAVAWSRSEALRRGLRSVEWWVGWTAAPADLATRLLASGLKRSDDPPTLTGMTCVEEPPRAPQVDVRSLDDLEDYLAALEEVDWEVWQIQAEERSARRETEIALFDEMAETGNVHHWAAWLDGRLAGFARGIDMAGAVALYGGAVLPELRGRGAYRALVHTRWRHAVARGTPALVVQAGPMSAPVLDGLGFVRHGEIELYYDRL